jgi:hypothetical protein
MAILMAMRPREPTVHNRMSPNPGPDCLGLISNADKTGSGQEHDLSYRTMVDARLTPAPSITIPAIQGASSLRLAGGRHWQQPLAVLKLARRGTSRGY